MYNTDDILNIVLIIPGILLGFTFHEYAHAIVAYKLGDSTPKFQGRLTLNPLAHIDIVGFVMLLLVNFGWAKPVQTNPNAYKDYYKDDLKVSIAGVIGNAIVALVAAIILGFLAKLSIAESTGIRVITIMVMLTIEINSFLIVLNLFPLPGFDGFHVLRDLFPKVFYKIEEFAYKYQYLIWAIFIMPIPGMDGAIIDFVLSGPKNIILGGFMKVTTLIAGM